MKPTPLLVLAALTGASVFGQGTVNFVNKIGTTVDARVFFMGPAGTVPAVGGGATYENSFVAQLYFMNAAGGWAQTGDPIPFRNSGAGTGYWVGQTRTLAGVPENGVATVKVVAWSAALGPTYETALSRFGFAAAGESAPITMTTGGGLNPPAPMLGLQGFVIGVPEPGSLALAGLGLACLTLVRLREVRASRA